MKESLLSVLRDKNTTTAKFRSTSDQIAHVLCAETLSKLTDGEIDIETPVGQAIGVPMPEDIMVVPIMRAALPLLPAFTQVLPDIPVGITGIERDETTASPRAYYKKFPRYLPDRAVILDPMLATGGSACLAVDLLLHAGYSPEAIYFTGVLAAREGLERLAQVIPQSHITLVAVDPELDKSKYIVLGLGDYGDRYYGT